MHFLHPTRGGQQSLLYQQSNRAPTLQFSHRIQKTSGARYSPTDCTDVHRLGGKTQPKNLCTSVKSVGGSSPPEASVYSVKSVGEYPPPEISVNSVSSVGGLAQTNLEWVLWKEFGGRRGYGRDAIPPTSVKICEICGRIFSARNFCEFREFCGRTCANKLGMGSVEGIRRLRGMASLPYPRSHKTIFHRIHGTHRNDWRRRKICVHLCNLWEALICQKVLWVLRVPWEILI